MKRGSTLAAAMLAVTSLAAGLGATPAAAIDSFGFDIHIVPDLSWLQRADIPANEQRWVRAHCRVLSQTKRFGRNKNDDGVTVPPHIAVEPAPHRETLVRSFPLRFLALDDCIRMGFVDE